jgi:nucleoside-diphosphate-sugar epimerase
VTAELLRRGHDVTALVRDARRIAGCRTVTGVVGQLDDAALAAVGEADAVIHLASTRTTDRELVLYFDVRGTCALMDAWARGPFVYLSSTTVHGRPRGVLTEHTPVAPTDWYDMGKVAAEFELGLAQKRAGRGAGISLRPALAFAVNERGLDRQYLGWVYDRCVEGRTFVFDSEQALESCGGAFVGGEDFAGAVAEALAVTDSGPYPLAGGFCTWRELIETVARHAGTRARIIVRLPGTPLTENECQLPQSRTELDSSAFVSRTGWAARQGLDELVGAFVRAVRTPPAAARA